MATLNGPFPSARGEDRGVAVPARPTTESVRLIQGMEGVLQSNAAAAQEIRSVAREMALANDRSLRMSSTVDALVGQQSVILRLLNGALLSATPQAAVQQVLGAGAQPAATALLAPGGGAGVMGPPRSPDAPGVVQPPTPDRPGSQSITRGHPGPPVHPAEPEGPSNYERLSGAAHYNLAQLRQDTSRWIGSKVSGMQIGPPIRPAANRRGYEIFDPDTDAALGPATRAQIRNMNIANRVRAIGGSMAEGRGAEALINAVPKGVIGPAAVAVGGFMVADQVAGQLENQRALNANYQRVLGGTNMEGIGQRASQALFSLSQRGVMDGEQSAQLFEGVTSLGLRGQERMEALDLAMDNWKRFGMEVNDTISLIRVNARNGIGSLTGIAEALQSVTDAARGANVSAEAARAQYTQAYTAAAPSFLGAGSAATAAGAITTAFTGLGEGYQEVDVSGMLSGETMRMIGARQGLTQAELLAQTSGTQGAGSYVRMSQAAVIDAANRLLGTRGKQMLSDYKRGKGISARTPLTSSQADELSVEMYRANLVQPQQAAYIIQQYGIQGVPLNKALAFLIMAIDGGWNPEQAVGEQMANASARDLSATARSNFGTDSTEGVSTMGEVISAVGGDPNLDTFTDADSIDANGNVVKGDTRLTVQTSGMFGRQNVDTARGLYLQQVADGKAQYSPIIAEMLKQGDFSQRFKINVGSESSPEYREMNMYDAIKYHSDQLARGNVEITSGSGEGQALATALGMNPDESVNLSYSGGGANAGKPFEAGGEGSRVNGSVEIYPSPELARLLRFRSVGGATMVTEPPSALTSAGSLPTGNASWGGDG